MRFTFAALGAACFVLFAIITIAAQQLEQHLLTFGLTTQTIKAAQVDPAAPLVISASGEKSARYSLYFKASGTDGFPNLLQTDDVNNGLRIELYGTTIAALYPLPNGLNHTVLTDELKLGRWYRLDVDVVDGISISLSLDGNLKASHEAPSIAFRHVIIGSGFSGTRPFQGEIRDVVASQGDSRSRESAARIFLGVQSALIVLFALSVGLIAPTHKSDLSGAPIQYRADIDGLRAISVIAVLAFHAFPAIWPGGFVGVDIFFVISGYLITRIIVDQYSAGTFSLVDFYRRRIVRIFPALVLVLAATYAMGWYRLLPAEFERLSTNILAGAGFVANLLLLKQPDYFAPEAATNPLLHLWSLGIEEQFYIFWPLILMALARYRRNTAIFACMAMGSFALCLWVVSSHQTIAFYAPLTRSWELLAGAILSELHRRRSSADMEVARWDGAKATAGIALIAFAMIFLSKTSNFPSWNALLPVLGACLLIDAPRSFLNARILSLRPIVFVGLISYPLYLWHWPILTFLHLTSDGPPPASSLFIALLLAFALAWATYELLEKPVKRQRFAALKLSMASATICIVCMATIAGSGFDFRLPKEIRQIAQAHFDEESRRESCFRYSRPGAENFGDDCIEKGVGPLIVIWGDSTAATYYAGLKSLQKQYSFRIGQLTAPGCKPIVGPIKSQHIYCEKVNDSALVRIEKAVPDIVLLKGFWWPEDIKSLGQTIIALRKLHVPRILLIGPDPWFGRYPPPDYALQYYRTHLVPPPERVRDLFILPPHETAMKQFAADQRIEYVSPSAAFCTEGSCVLRVGPTKSDLVAFDTSHLTANGAEFFIHQIANDLFPNQPLQTSEK